MVAFDASSMIHAWDNYPLENFPPLWDWIAIELASEQIVMSQVAFEEVERKIPECGEWLRDNNIQHIQISNPIITVASQIKRLLGIANDNYHPKGVDENDIFIISTSKVQNIRLISNENIQLQLPIIHARFKIPAVCQLPQVNVDCIAFINFIRDSRHVFR